MSLRQDSGRGLAPGVGANDRVVVFDGVCKLCSAWARFLIRFDRKAKFKLATVQSAHGQAILLWFGLPTDVYETMLLIEGPAIYTKSTAFLRIVRRLPFPWPILSALWLVPSFIRDWVYALIARNRYALFGRYEVCMMPEPEHASRFLSSNET